jgi:chromosome segregation ATPase
VATLEEAAQELVDTLEALDSECQAAQKTIADHQEDLSELDGQIASDWNALTEEVTTFLEAVEEQAGLLAQDGNEAANELGALRGETEAAQAGAEAEIVGSRDDLAALAEHLRSLEPSIDAIVASGAEAPFTALREQADDVREQLERAVTEAREFLEEVAREVEATAQAVEERSEELRAHIAEECTATLQTAYDAWESHVEELETLVKDKFEELPENAREVVEYAMTECVKGHEEELDQMLALVPDVERAIEELKNTIAETATDIGEEGFGALDRGLGGLGEALTRTTEALDRVKALLASYTFVAM